jgi:hypothetical protein
MVRIRSTAAPYRRLNGADGAETARRGALLLIVGLAGVVAAADLAISPS